MRARHLVLAGLLLSLVSGWASAQQLYRLSDLGTLGGTLSEGAAINSTGQVTGSAYTAGNAEYHAFLWDGTEMMDLGTLGGTSSQGRAINDAGQVTGVANGPLDNSSNPFLWDGTTMMDLGLPPNAHLGIGQAINASGQVTGYASDSDNRYAMFWDHGTMVNLSALGGSPSEEIDNGRDINASGHVTGIAALNDGTAYAFLWDGTTMRDLGNLGGLAGSIGYAINDAGSVTGGSSSVMNFGAERGFLWDGTTLQDLGTLGGDASWGIAINASGQVAGLSYLPDNVNPHGFVWNGTTMVDIGTLGSTYSTVTAINASAQVTGFSYTASFDQRAILWDGTALHDLNDLVDPTDPLQPFVTLNEGRDINDLGQVLAQGCDSRTGNCHAYLVSPVDDYPGDGDGDGIADSIDTAPVTPSDAFSDDDETSGVITDRAGLAVTIEDAASPDGVRVVAGAGSGQITLSACGFTVTVDAASELVVTCGSVTLNVIQGVARIILDGIVTVISIPAGIIAQVTDNGDGTFLVQNVGGVGVVTVTVGGTQTTIAPGGSQSYTVTYQFRGFFSPIDNLPTLNVAKGGSAIPVKFSLGGNQGLTIFAAGHPKSQKVSCTSSVPLDAIEQTVTAGASSLSYNAGADQYHYVWKTEKSWAGTCRQLVLKLNDSTSYIVNFKFK